MTDPAPGFGEGPDAGVDAVILNRMTDTLTILQCKRPTESRAAMIAALKTIRDKADDDAKVMIVVEGKTEELFVRQFLATLNQTSIGAAEVYVARANASPRRVADILGRATGPAGKSARRHGTVSPLAVPRGSGLDFCQNAAVDGATDLARLRELVRGAAGGLVNFCTHEELGNACANLGLPEPPRQVEPGSGKSLTKRKRVEWSLASLADEAVPVVARRMLAGRLPGPLDAATRNAIEDLLWASHGVLEIPRRTRRDIAQALDLSDVTLKADRFTALLDRLWALDTSFDPWGDGESSRSLRKRIERHVIRNPDWSAEELFDELGAIDSAGDARFARFLEGLASADVVPDEAAQRRVVAAVNPHLLATGTELRETGEDGGYPVFSVVSARAARGRPKNLIFASTSRSKPDIRIIDAIDNDIEIVSNAEDVLVYDRPTHEGVLWRDLQSWWKDTRQITDDDEAKGTLYKRLRGSLPESSPPQRTLFDLYHHIHRDELPGLPALLPEVWLHWDPRTVRERGLEAMLRFRMDFLLLLPHGHRVVLEVDGATHYSTDGHPDAAVYAGGVRADRELKLARYEVFRFGAAELQNPESAGPMLRQFFADLFRQFGVSLALPEQVRG